MPPRKKLSRDSLSNWCDADADEDTDANISKQYVDLHPTGAQHNEVIRNLSMKLCATFDQQSHQTVTETHSKEKDSYSLPEGHTRNQKPY